MPVASRHEVQDEAEPAAKEVDVHAWPSLASAVQASPDGARKGWVQHANSGPLFSRSLFAQSPASESQVWQIHCRHKSCDHELRA